MEGTPILHAALDSRGDIALWLFFLVPWLVTLVGVPLIYRSSRWAGARPRTRSPQSFYGDEPV